MSTAIWPPRLDAAALAGSGFDAPLGISGMRPGSLLAGALDSAGLGSAVSLLGPEAAASVLAAAAPLAAGKAPASAVRVCPRKLADADDSTPSGFAPSACPRIGLSSR